MKIKTPAIKYKDNTKDKTNLNLFRCMENFRKARTMRPTQCDSVVLGLVILIKLGEACVNPTR